MTDTKHTLRGRRLYVDGAVVAEIIGMNDGTTRHSRNSAGGYGYRLADGTTTTRDWPYFADAVKAARAALAKAL